MCGLIMIAWVMQVVKHRNDAQVQLPCNFILKHSAEQQSTPQ